MEAHGLLLTCEPVYGECMTSGGDGDSGAANQGSVQKQSHFYRQSLHRRGVLLQLQNFFDIHVLNLNYRSNTGIVRLTLIMF